MGDSNRKPSGEITVYGERLNEFRITNGFGVKPRCFGKLRPVMMGIP